MTGKLLGICVRKQSGAPTTELTQTNIDTTTCVAGDYRNSQSKRMVTVLRREDWDAATAEAGAIDLHWTRRRANLLVDGIDVAKRVGDHITIGSVVLEITGETHPCQQMDDAHQGLRAKLENWRGGVTCRVVAGGDIAVGEDVLIS